MKSSFGSKGERKDLLISEGMTRREFLKAGVGLAVAASGLEMISSCAATETPKDRIIPTKEKSDYKIYPPQDGCLVGFHKEHNKRFQVGREISTTINHYRNALDANPAILAFWSFLSLGFPVTEAKTIRENGIVPYVSIMPGHEAWRPSFDPDDVVHGRCDRYIKRLATDASGFGERHGSFFFTTMVEPNGSVWLWQGKPNTAPAVKRVWQIFEDQGANQYATWV
jgi:hypothetical protein